MASFLSQWAPGFGAAVLAFGLAWMFVSRRTRAMRALASRLGFQYQRFDLPDSFSMTCYPVDSVKLASNVIEGHRGGVRVLIFDSVIGEGRGTYCTFIACCTELNPFGSDVFPEQLVQSDGWTALYRLKVAQTPGSIGIDRIEHYLSKLSA